MTTVLAVYNSDGCVGRCDANCHEAKVKECTCICGGKNHGAGLQQAIENNREMIGLTPEDLSRFAAAHGFKCEELQVYDAVKTKPKWIAKQRKRDAQRKAAEERRKAYNDLYGRNQDDYYGD